MASKNCATIKNKLNYKNKHKNILIVVVRCCIVICVFLLACCVCYLTIIVPDPSDVVCNRKCHRFEWPMICRYKFIVESQTVFGKTVFTINKTIPGPSIIVCANDIIVIDVENRIPELSITLHWHGQRQHETPFMDGVPMITQCPISSFTTFQYKFRASEIGTHFYYAYSGRMRNYGTLGKFIVNEPTNGVPNMFYNISTFDHIVMISEFRNRLVVDAKKFFVIPRMRYRFRIIYGSGENGYPIKLEIKNHTLNVIAIDGHRINPVDRNAINLNLGDRIDFILYADKIEKCEFGVKIISTKINQTWHGLLIYDRQRNISTEELTHLNVVNDTNFDERLEMVNKTIYIPIIRYTVAMNHQTDYRPTDCLRSEGIIGIGNLTFTFPSKPYYLTTQWPNECRDHYDSHTLGGSCDNIAFGSLCDCVHVQRVDHGDYVEIIFVNFDESDSYTYHLHGYSFFIVGVSKITNNSATLRQIRTTHENNNLLDRNFWNPQQKDTVTIESKSIVGIRFVADNPGYWMLRELKSNSWTRGIDLVLKVGDNLQIIQPPNTFPKCGDWIGPTFGFV